MSEQPDLLYQCGQVTKVSTKQHLCLFPVREHTPGNYKIIGISFDRDLMRTFGPNDTPRPQRRTWRAATRPENLRSSIERRSIFAEFLKLVSAIIGEFDKGTQGPRVAALARGEAASKAVVTSLKDEMTSRSNHSAPRLRVLRSAPYDRRNARLAQWFRLFVWKTTFFFRRAAERRHFRVVCR